MTYQKLAIYIERQLHLRLKLIAAKEGTSLSDLADRLLSGALDADRPVASAPNDEDDPSG